MTIKLESYKIHFYRQQKEDGVDGYVQYNYKVQIMGTDDWYDADITQPFSRKGSYETFYEMDRPNGLPMRVRGLVWAWNGNRKEPSLTPSFLIDVGAMGKLHLYVRDGKLDILNDTTFICKDVKKL